MSSRAEIRSAFHNLTQAIDDVEGTLAKVSALPDDIQPRSKAKSECWPFHQGEECDRYAITAGKVTQELLDKFPEDKKIIAPVHKQLYGPDALTHMSYKEASELSEAMSTPTAALTVPQVKYQKFMDQLKNNEELLQVYKQYVDEHWHRHDSNSQDSLRGHFQLNRMDQLLVPSS